MNDIMEFTTTSNLKKIYIKTPEGYKRADQIMSENEVICDPSNTNKEFTVIQTNTTKRKDVEIIDEVYSVSSSDSTKSYVEPEFVDVVPLKMEPMDEANETSLNTKQPNMENFQQYVKSEYVDIPVKQELREKLLDETFDSNITIDTSDINLIITNPVQSTFNLITPTLVSNPQDLQYNVQNYNIQNTMNISQNIQQPSYIQYSNDYIVRTNEIDKQGCILKNTLQDKPLTYSVLESPSSYTYIPTSQGYQRVDLIVDDKLKQKLKYLGIDEDKFNEALHTSLGKNSNVSIHWLKERALQILINSIDTKAVINKEKIIPYLVNLKSNDLPLTNNNDVISSNIGTDIIKIENSDSSDENEPNKSTEKCNKPQAAEIKIEIIPDNPSDELHTSVWIKDEPVNDFEEIDEDDNLSEFDTDEDDEEIKSTNSNVNYAYIRTTSGYQRADTLLNQDKEPVLYHTTYLPKDLKELTDLFTQGKKYVCNICGKPITQKKQYEIHYKSHDIEEFLKRDYICEFCSKSYHSKRFLNKHKFYAHTERNITCNICKAKYKTEKGLKMHKQVKHANEKSSYFECDECGKIFLKKSLHKLHIKTHAGKMFKCTECNACFNRKDNLISHVKMHKGQKDYKCNDCGKDFVRSDNLKRHMISHSTERPFECKLCSKKFKDKIYLKQHVEKHKSKRKRKSDPNNGSESNDSSQSN